MILSFVQMIFRKTATSLPKLPNSLVFSNAIDSVQYFIYSEFNCSKGECAFLNNFNGDPNWSDEYDLYYPEDVLYYLASKLKDSDLYIFALVIIYNSHPDHGNNPIYGLPIQFLEENISWLPYKKRTYEAALIKLETTGFITHAFHSKKKHYVVTVRGNQLSPLLHQENNKFREFINELKTIKIYKD